MRAETAVGWNEVGIEAVDDGTESQSVAPTCGEVRHLTGRKLNECRYKQRATKVNSFTQNYHKFLHLIFLLSHPNSAMLDCMNML
jgi:hypothetical protein